MVIAQALRAAGFKVDMQAMDWQTVVTRRAVFGWPDVPEIERLRVEFSRSSDEAKHKEMAGQIQKLVIDEGVVLPMGQYYVPAAYRKSLSGALEAPVPVFWNIQKK